MSSTPIPPPIMATFVPGVWKQGRVWATEGKGKFDVVYQILDMTVEAVKALKDNSDNTDSLALEIISKRKHTGPYSVQVEVALLEFLKLHHVKSLKDLTAKRWEEIQALYAPARQKAVKAAAEKAKVAAKPKVKPKPKPRKRKSSGDNDGFPVDFPYLPKEDEPIDEYFPKPWKKPTPKPWQKPIPKPWQLPPSDTYWCSTKQEALR